MKREDIEKAAGDYSGSILGFKDSQSVMAKHKAFSDGAEWRINSVWHDASENPKEKEHIVVVTESGSFTSWYVGSDIMEVFRKYNIVKWAYSEDLLPTKN